MNIVFSNIKKGAETVGQVFENLYIAVRQQEQRVYADEQLVQLPEIASGHVHFNEWKIRKQSANRLINYLSDKKRTLNILEIGCGNGWLSSKLAGIKNSNVVAIDINEIEIIQAKRVFNKENLQFIFGSFDPEKFKNIKFDVIVFAASLQYFCSLKKLFQQVQQSLIAYGEIHILDTNFYDETNVDDAVKRTAFYFEQQGYPEMAGYYFHHLLDDLNGFNYRILYNPNHIVNRFLNNNPFYWICINK